MPGNSNDRDADQSCSSYSSLTSSIDNTMENDTFVDVPLFEFNDSFSDSDSSNKKLVEMEMGEFDLTHVLNPTSEFEPNRFLQPNDTPITTSSPSWLHRFLKSPNITRWMLIPAFICAIVAWFNFFPAIDSTDKLIAGISGYLEVALSSPTWLEFSAAACSFGMNAFLNLLTTLRSPSRILGFKKTLYYSKLHAAAIIILAIFCGYAAITVAVLTVQGMEDASLTKIAFRGSSIAITSLFPHAFFALTGLRLLADSLLLNGFLFMLRKAINLLKRPLSFCFNIDLTLCQQPDYYSNDEKMLNRLFAKIALVDTSDKTKLSAIRVALIDAYTKTRQHIFNIDQILLPEINFNDKSSTANFSETILSTLVKDYKKYRKWFGYFLAKKSGLSFENALDFIASESLETGLLLYAVGSCLPNLENLERVSNRWGASVPWLSMPLAYGGFAAKSLMYLGWANTLVELLFKSPTAISRIKANYGLTNAVNIITILLAIGGSVFSSVPYGATTVKNLPTLFDGKFLALLLWIGAAISSFFGLFGFDIIPGWGPVIFIVLCMSAAAIVNGCAFLTGSQEYAAKGIYTLSPAQKDADVLINLSKTLIEDSQAVIPVSEKSYEARKIATEIRAYDAENYPTEGVCETLGSYSANASGALRNCSSAFFQRIDAVIPCNNNADAEDEAEEINVPLNLRYGSIQ